MMRTGTNPDYARQRVQEHLLRFSNLHRQLAEGAVQESLLEAWERQDNIFPNLCYRHYQ